MTFEEYHNYSCNKFQTNIRNEHTFIFTTVNKRSQVFCHKQWKLARLLILTEHAIYKHIWKSEPLFHSSNRHIIVQSMTNTYLNTYKNYEICLHFVSVWYPGYCNTYLSLHIMQNNNIQMSLFSGRKWFMYSTCLSQRYY